MKDTVVTARRKRIELISLGICLLLAVLLNIGCIIFYKTSFTEVYTQVGFMLVFALVFYLVFTLGRMLWWCMRKLFGK